MGKLHILLIKNTNSDSSSKLFPPHIHIDAPMQRYIVGGMCTNKTLSHFPQKREGMSEEPQVKDSNDNRTVIPKSSIYKCNGKVPKPSNGRSNGCPSPTRKFPYLNQNQPPMLPNTHNNA